MTDHGAPFPPDRRTFVRAEAGAAIGGFVGGGLNGLSLYLQVPQKISSFEPWIILAGCFHGMMLAIMVRAVLHRLWRRRPLLGPGGYVGGVVGGMVGVWAFYALVLYDESYLACLRSWEGWRQWGLLFGGPVGLALGLAGTFGLARSRLARLARNVFTCELLCSLAALVFWCYGIGGVRKWEWDFWVTGATHGAIFGTTYALGVALACGDRGPLLAERVRAPESPTADRPAMPLADDGRDHLQRRP